MEHLDKHKFFTDRRHRLRLIGIEKDIYGSYPERTKASKAIYTAIRNDLLNGIFLGYYISGGFGTGKSTLLALIADMLLAAKINVRYIGIAEYLERAKAANRPYGFSDRHTLFENLRKADYMLLDNFGWSVYSKEDIGAITDLFRYRYDNIKATIIASNLDLHKMLNDEKSIRPDVAAFYKQIADYTNDDEKYQIFKIKNGESLRGKKDTNNFRIEQSLISKLSFYKKQISEETQKATTV